MRHANVLKLAVGVGLALVIACSDSAESAFSDPRGAKAGDADGGESDGTDKGTAAAPNAGGDAPQGAPASDGVFLVHAASFPAFRLCFSNYMDLPPQPDAAVMPQANVVGVEVGSIVRIPRFEKAPGTVYVVRENDVRARVGETNRTCNDYIQRTDAGADNTSIREGQNYVIAKTVLNRPVGVDHAEILAISGCGSQGILDGFDNVAIGQGSRESCGDGFDTLRGNADVHVVALEGSPAIPTDSTIPIELYNMAPAVKALSGTAAVKFGDPKKPDDGLPLTMNPLFESGARTILDVDQTNEKSYGALGFTVKVSLPSDAINASQTLADVQHASAPDDTPTSYYLAASNYALLVLGDPSHKQTLAGGAPNPGWNPRRALHILAVPIIDPTKQQDAGALSDASTDAGVK